MIIDSTFQLSSASGREGIQALAPKKRSTKKKTSSASPEQLAIALSQTEYTFRYQRSKLPINVINVLPQPRKTFDGVPELAEDIKRKNLLNPLAVARFDPDNCHQYLQAVNFLWNTDFQLKNLSCATSDGLKIYYVLLAGERRLRAVRLLWNEGCQQCQEKYGPIKSASGQCFRRHFHTNMVDVSLCANIPPAPALMLQLSENTHMSVPAHEEARAYSQFYRALKEYHPDTTLTSFAESVGRSPQTIRNALRYCQLPDPIQEAVENKQITYGIAIELSRLSQLGDFESDDLNSHLQWWYIKVLVGGRIKVSDFHNMITDYVAHQSAGQTSLLDLMEETMRLELAKPQYRRVVAANMIQGVWYFIEYFRRVMQLFQDGKLGQQDSPFSELSPTRVFRQLIELQRRLLPHLRQFLPRSQIQKITTALDRLLNTTAALENDHQQRGT